MDEKLQKDKNKPFIYQNSCRLTVTNHRNKHLMLNIKSEKEELSVLLPRDSACLLQEWLRQNNYISSTSELFNQLIPFMLPKNAESMIDNLERAKVIHNAVIEGLGISERKIRSAAKTKPITRARYLLFFMLRKWTSLSYPQIGMIYRKNHAGIIIGCRAVKANPARFEPHLSLLDSNIKRMVKKEMFLKKDETTK